MIGVGIHALLHSPTIDLEFVPLEEPCVWGTVLPAPPGAPEDVSSTDDPVCVRALAGVELAGPSLVREPGYLEDQAQFLLWLEHQRALYEAVDGRPTAELTLAQPGGETRALELPVRPGTLGLGARHVVPLFTIAVLAGWIGAFVLYRRPREPAARALFLLAQGLCLIIVTTEVTTSRGLAFPPWETRLLWELNIAGNLLAAGAFYHLAALFPVPRFGRWRLWLAYVLPVVLVGGGYLLQLGGVFRATQSIASLFALAAMVLFVLSLFRQPGQVRRLQARWMMWGLLLPLIAWIVLRLPTLLGFWTVSDPTDTAVAAACVTIPGGIAMAILRDRLLEIDVVIRRTLIGAAVTLVVLFLYHLVISAFVTSLASEAQLQRSWSDTVLIVALVLTLVFVPVQARLDNVLDRVFFRRRLRHRRILSRLPDELAMLDAPSDAAQLVLDRIGPSTDARVAVVALVPTGGDINHWAWISSPSRSTAELPTLERLSPPEGATFWEQVEAVGDVGLGSRDETGGALDSWLESTGLEIVLPLRTPNALVGVLACGLRSRGRLFGAEEVSLLRTVAASLALTLSRSQAYQTVRRMNEELEEKIRERTASLEQTRLQLYQWERMASLGVLAAGVAHELNTPLGVVVSTAEQLVRDMDKGDAAPARTDRLIALCADAAQRATDIVQNLRSFSTPESRDLQTVDLGDVVDLALQLLETKLERSGIAVRVHKGDIPSIEGYPVLLYQIASNLLLNAASAIGRDGLIEIRTEQRGADRVALIVEDDGPGVPPDVQPRIFEPFFTTRAPGEGTGLGLSLCYAFVKQHQGRIWEEGTFGHGARFVVELPLARLDETLDPLPSAEMPGRLTI